MRKGARAMARIELLARIASEKKGPLAGAGGGLHFEQLLCSTVQPLALFEQGLEFVVRLLERLHGPVQPLDCSANLFGGRGLHVELSVHLAGRLGLIGEAGADEVLNAKGFAVLFEHDADALEKKVVGHFSFLLFGTIAACSVSASWSVCNSIYQEKFFYFSGNLPLFISILAVSMRKGARALYAPGVWPGSARALGQE